MTQFLLKTLISALLIAGASELSRRNVHAAALLISLPLTSILALAWLWHDTGDLTKITAMSHSILFMVLPSLLCFVLLPLLLKAGLHFWLALALSCLGMAAVYALWVRFLASWFGVDLA